LYLQRAIREECLTKVNVFVLILKKNLLTIES